jgi:hypothetical protein
LRAFADQAVSRSLPEFRQAVFFLDNHTIGLEPRVAAPYIEKAREIAQAALDIGEDKNSEYWAAAQYALVVAFPHINGDAQFDALINHPEDRTVLLELASLLEPIAESKLECALEKAVVENDPVTQFRILCFAEYSRSPLSLRTKELVLSLLVSTNDHVRLSALGLIQATGDPLLLTGLAQSNWSAVLLDAVEQKIELLHGSQALVLAAKQGAITVEACLDRIALSAYESLALELGNEATLAVADRLNTAIRKAAEFQVSGSLPNIEQSFEGRYWSVVLQVSEKPSQDETQDERFQRIAESSDAWYERQKRNQEVANRFEQDLTKAGAELITHSVTVRLIEAIDNVTPAFIDSWCTFFQSLDKKALNNVYNIASVVAEAISKRNGKPPMSVPIHV